MSARNLCLAAILGLVLVSCLTPGAETFRGRVTVYGSEPHVWVGLETEDGRVYALFPPEKEAELRPLQGRLLKIRVRFLEEPPLRGDGTANPLWWKIIR